MTVSLGGIRRTKGQMDAGGHRSYSVWHYVRSDTGLDGPANVMRTAGLPEIGDVWAYNDDYDPWAFCLLTKTPTVIDERPGDLPRDWEVESVFQTPGATGSGPGSNNNKPDRKFCKDFQFDDPLLEPHRISGSFQKYTKEMAKDRYGDPFLNTAFEPIRGPDVEFDASRPQVVIEQNVAALELELCGSMVNAVNDDLLWGLPARCIKLSEFTWEKKFYGKCYAYYTRRFVFDAAFRAVIGVGTAPTEYISEHDRDILNQGTKCIRGDWQRDPASVQYGRYVVSSLYDLPHILANPANFVRYKDFNGENVSGLLTERGAPFDAAQDGTAGTAIDVQYTIHAEYYQEANFLLLGIPTVL